MKTDCLQNMKKRIAGWVAAIFADRMISVSTGGGYLEIMTIKNIQQSVFCIVEKREIHLQILMLYLGTDNAGVMFQVS